MKIDQKILNTLLDLLDENKPINKHSLCRRASVHRFSLDRLIRKHKQIIDTEIC
ncbi:MAG: hypothetical protein Q8R86_09635 [Sulfuricurvum sp.]|nr:hypothetical protein [Sulfuricurvum sp.]